MQQWVSFESLPGLTPCSRAINGLQAVDVWEECKRSIFPTLPGSRIA
jgi:hypothetical protein